jgi:site-specific DNA-methyltransferase (adenine-specific)
MNVTNNMEECFHLLDKSSSYISQEFEKTYLESLIDSAESLFQGEIVITTTDEQKAFLRNIFEDFNVQKYTKEDIRRAMQLAILKGIKEKSIVGTGITPDAIVIFIGYLTKRLVKPTTILDPAVGSGNLLTCIMNQYDHGTVGVGSEVDSSLVRVAYVNANLQQHEVELFHQDGVKPLYTPLAELTVCDLPVGMYPNKKVASSYSLYKENEVNEGDVLYTHHLLIEQSIRLTEEGGFLIFLIPNTLFTEPGADALKSLINETCNIQGILQLPSQLFQQGSIHKSIFILQRKGNHIKKPKQILMANLPSFTDKDKFSQAIQQINSWIDTEVN